jgi:hypothetical protein
MLMGFLASASAVEKTGYETGYPAIEKIVKDLHQALDAKVRTEILPQPVFWDNLAVPYVHPGMGKETLANKRAVHFSAGMVSLLVNLSHAKAIDGVERGFYKKYMAALAQEVGDKPLAGLPNLGDAKVWSFDVMNHQVSRFNQMAGALVAIGMAEHYLGYYDKYASQLQASQPVPINTLLTAEEWTQAVYKGAWNALDCGLGIDGLKTLLEAMENMPNRPAWAIYFVPKDVNLPKVKKELEKLEKKFFNNL